MERRPSRVIIGPDGSGRSHAVGEIVRSHGGLIVDLSPRPGERNISYGPLRRVAEQELSDAETAFGTLESRRGPRTMFVLDDAHVVDDATLTVLTRVVNLGATVVVARRPVVRSPALADLDDAAGRSAQVVSLGPVGPEVMAEQLGLDDAADLQRRCGGLLGLAAIVAADRTLATLGARVQRRVAGLSRPAVELVRLLSVAPGDRWDDEGLAEALGLDRPGLLQAFHELSDVGFAPPGEYAVVPVVGEIVLQSLDAAASRALHGRVAAALERVPGRDPVVVAEHWRASGSRRPTAAAAFVAAGRSTASVRPTDADAWFDLALDAGADAGSLWLDMARVATALGRDLPAEPDDHAGVDPTARRLLEGIRAVQDGRWAAGVEILRSCGPAARAVLVPALVACGDVAAAAELVDAAGPAADGLTLLDQACIAAARLQGDPTPLFLHAARQRASTGGGQLLPEDPDTLGAIVASTHDPDDSWQLFCPDRAGDLGVVANRRRHLLRAFLEMRRGRYEAPMWASAHWADTRLTGREEVLLAAIQAGLSRRAIRPALQRAAWQRVAAALITGGVDLFSLEPIEELLVAAARHRDDERVRTVLGRLHALVAPLEAGAAWRAQVAWIEVQVGVAYDDADRVAAAADVLQATAWSPTGRQHAYRLASRAWVGVLRRRIDDLDAVVAAAEHLERVGLAFEAGQLLGQAALDLPVADSRTGKLLRLAQSATRTANSGVRFGEGRDLAPPAPSDRTPAPGSVDPTAGDGLLSAREEQVAELKFLGYRNHDIAARLFIGVKTVETHVTRLNNKLGATTKAEFVDTYGRYRSRRQGP